MRKGLVGILLLGLVSLAFAVTSADKAPRLAIQELKKASTTPKFHSINPVKKFKKPEEISAKGQFELKPRFRHPRILSGGPDGYGYTYLSTQDGDTVTYNWIDISTTGEPLGLLDDDHTVRPLSFTFRFYNDYWDSVFIGSNGVVYFSHDPSTYIGLSNTGLPSSAYSGPHSLIGVLWDDQNPSAGGEVYFQDFGNYAVVEYLDVPHYGQDTLPNTYEVILYDDGRIKLQYRSVQYYGDATIGIQDNEVDTVNNWYLEYVYNGDPAGHVPDQNVAILFIPPPPAAHDVGVTSIDAPSGLVAVGATVTPAATVANFGQYQETFDVYFEIYDSLGNMVYQDNTTITLDPSANQQVTFSDFSPSERMVYTTVAYTVLAGDEVASNDTSFSGFETYLSGNNYIVVDLDGQNDGYQVFQILQNLGIGGDYTVLEEYIDADSLAGYTTAWIFLGIYGYGNYALSDDQVTEISDYLNAGGRVYLEGGDCWGYDASRYNLDPLFGIDPNNTSDGSGDLTNIAGVSNYLIPDVAGHTWSYGGANNWIDRLGVYTAPPYGGVAQAYLENPDVGYNCGVAYSNTTWNAVGNSFQVGYVTQTSKSPDSLVMWIYNFLTGPLYQIHDVAVISINSPIGPYVEPSATYPVEATIKNTGSYDEVDFYVYAEIPEAGYSSSYYVSSLAAGETLTVTFDDWTVPADSGDFTLYVYTALAGDELPSNDTLVSALRNYRIPGDVLAVIDAEAATGDNQLLGVEFDGTYFYVTGGASGSDPNKLYVIDTLGNLICTIDQPSWSTYWGWRDLASDAANVGLPTDSLYASVTDSVDMFGVNSDCSMTVFGKIPGPEYPNRALAYRPSDAHLFTANFTSDIYEFDKTGAVINQWTNTYSIYGGAYDDSLNMVWFSSQDLNAYGFYNLFVLFDPSTGTVVDSISPLMPYGWVDGIAGGLDYYADYNGFDVLVELVQGSPTDFIGVYYLREHGPAYICGDVNGDGYVTADDFVYLGNYIFFGGPAPVSMWAADVNGDGTVTADDFVYLGNYLFYGGPAPNCP